jgi:hypothetical protein
VRTAHLQALERAVAARATRVQGRLLNNLGIMAWEHADYPEALLRYEAALSLYRQLDDPAGIGLMLNSLAASLNAMRRHEEARRHLEEALPVHRRCGNQLLEGHACAMLGDIALELGEPDRALWLFTESHALREATGDRLGEGWMHIRIASAQVKLGRPDRAVEHAVAARRIADECDDNELVLACEQLLRAATPTIDSGRAHAEIHH